MAQNFFGDQGTGFAWWAALLLEIAADRRLPLGHPRGHRRPQRDQRRARPARHRPGPGDDPLRRRSSATGTSVNPARSIGVGVFAGTDAIIQLWLFIVAPLARRGHRRPRPTPSSSATAPTPVAGSGLNFGGGRKDQFVPGNYEAQWNQGQNQGQPGGWGQPGAAWGAPPQQRSAAAGSRRSSGRPRSRARPLRRSAGSSPASGRPAPQQPPARSRSQPARPVGRRPARRSSPVAARPAGRARPLGQPRGRRRRPHPGAPPRLIELSPTDRSQPSTQSTARCRAGVELLSTSRIEAEHSCSLDVGLERRGVEPSSTRSATGSVEVVRRSMAQHLRPATPRRDVLLR